jgi:tetratricopeptide (TPR) repeat protein
MTDSDIGFGSELRRLRTAAGLSLSDLADRIHYSKGYLSKLETGLAQPNHTVASLCDSELGTEGVLTGMVAKHRRKRARARSRLVRPVGLPPADTYFTGRVEQVNEVRTVLLATEPDTPAVCVIDGMAGVGKTALALQVAHQVDSWFPDGCLFLDLDGRTPDTALSSSDALDRFLRLLGVPVETIPTELDDRAAMYRGCLRDLRMLVVLDNAVSAQQVRPLLPGDRGCRVLVTSRHRLVALDDAHHVSLDVLGSAESAALFGKIVGPGRLGSEPDAARRVTTAVARCGHLPLAVRIAAARWRANPTQSLTAFTELLGARTTVLRQLDDGERSVSAAFQLSYDGLPEEQRRLFGLLAEAPGTDVDDQAAGALAGVSGVDAGRLLDRLLDAHLLDQRAAGRYRSHDLVRTFAAQMAARDLPEADRTGALARLLDHEVDAVTTADVLLAPHRYRPEITFDHPTSDRRDFPDADAATTWLRTEWSNLVALCRRAGRAGRHARCWQLAYLLRGYFFLAKHWDPWIETHQLALSSARAADDLWAQGVTLNGLGIAHVDRGDIEQAPGYYREALAVFTDLGDEHGQASAVANLGWVDHYAGRHGDALDRLNIALAVYRRTEARQNVAITLRGIALAETGLGAYADAITHLTDALSTLDDLGSPLDVAMSLNCLGWVHFRSGQHGEAASAYRRALSAGERATSPYEIARAETGLGNVAAAQDRLDEAQRYWDRAEARDVALNTTTVAEHGARLAPATG